MPRPVLRHRPAGQEPWQEEWRRHYPLFWRLLLPGRRQGMSRGAGSADQETEVGRYRLSTRHRQGLSPFRRRVAAREEIAGGRLLALW
ncbi:hypothetical protein [Streptomyces sp. JNUCC 63]